MMKAEKYINVPTCSYKEGNKWKIMVAGGVIQTGSGQFQVTESVEVMDWNTKTWRTERVLPRKLTGRISTFL